MGMTLPLFVEDRRLILQEGWTRETLDESREVSSVRPSFPLPTPMWFRHVGFRRTPVREKHGTDR